LKNTTITGNEGAFRGGGIYFDATYGGGINLANTIVANNTANYSSDCYGPISSAGYNIIGDTVECSFNNAAGDQLNVNPKLGPLQNNGGNTLTHWLYEGSPAIDGGNPAGCTDHLGNPLTTDQRGNTRPMDGNSDANIVCDIGAYEADPNNLPVQPLASLWYVTPVGDDHNDCRTPATACVTIQNVMDKAVSNDIIYASMGVYTMTSGNEVVLIDKNINLLGGWNSTFTGQSGRSTIDGQHYQRGLTIDEQVTVNIENFIVQNGLAIYADIIGYGGGGIYIGYRSKVTLSNSIVQANIAGSDNPRILSSPNGGGIAMNNYGSLTLNDSAVVGNFAYGKGGGISSGESILVLNNSIVGYNSADTGGGISGGGQIKVNQSKIINNTNTDAFTGGGGIHCFNGTLIVKDSLVSGNVAAGEGGGIYGITLTIDHSSISGNKAASGGGISNSYKVDIRNSSISYNTATYGNGGGIYSRGDLVLVNTTIAYNKARNPSTYQANGGGIFRAGGIIQASNVTIAKNEAEDAGGGIWNQSAPVTLRNSLLADNEAAIGPDCTGTIGTAGYNLLGSLSGCSFSPGTGDLTNLDPRLALSYGWPGVLAVRANSPAIDGGAPSGCVDDQSNGITTDQIGTVRSIDGNEDGNSICDIGAYEYDPVHLPQWVFLPLVTR
jgi:predicted outer membrane repeat protein